MIEAYLGRPVDGSGSKCFESPAPITVTIKQHQTIGINQLTRRMNINRINDD
jgi:hypothetical protein